MKNQSCFAAIFSSFILLNGCNYGAPGSVQPVASEFNTKIQNGDLVKDPRLNSMIPLIYVNKINARGNLVTSICTGTVIGDDKILTAAHCVLDMAKKNAQQNYTYMNVVPVTNIKVMFNQDKSIPFNLAKITQTPIEIYNITEAYVHQDAYKGAAVLDNGDLSIFQLNQLNDVAILKLARKLDRNKYAMARIPFYAITPAKGTKLILAGYGVNQGAEVIRSDPWAGASGVLRAAVSQLDEIKDNYMFIYGRDSLIQGYSKICQGDSGGPVLIADGSQYLVVGVHSFGVGVGCGAAYAPGASLNTSYYRDWINFDYLIYHL